MKTITIELPDTITINGASKAPQYLREVRTAAWTPEFCLTAILHGVSQKIGDTWSVSKGDREKTAAVHKNMEAGEWASRERTGESAAKFQEKINKLDAVDLAKLLSPEQQQQLLAAFAAMKSE